MELLMIAVAGSLFVGFVLLFLLLTPADVSSRLEKVTSQDRLPEVPSAVTLGSGGGGVRLLGKLAKVFTPLPRLLGFGPGSDVTKRLAMAGYRQPEHAEIFSAAKFVLPFVAAFGAWFFLQDNRLFGTIVAAGVGFLLVDLWLTHAIRKRQDLMRLSLPDALDLLSICMEAGLGLDQALLRVGHELRVSHPDLSTEFLLVNLEQRAGKPRMEAWRNMADRTGIESIRSFVNMLVQTERFGTPISKSLGAFSDALRVKRRQQAEEMAAKTTIKMIFPLVLFIFPSLFIVLLAPAIILIMRNLGSAFAGGGP